MQSYDSIIPRGNTDLHIQSLYWDKELDLEPIREYTDWWYSALVFHHRPTKKVFLAVTRTMRSGITIQRILEDKIEEVLGELDRAAEAEVEAGKEDEGPLETLNALLCKHRNNGFEIGFAYNSGQNFEEWFAWEVGK